MSSEKRFIFASIISLIILFGYQILFPKKLTPIKQQDVINQTLITNQTAIQESKSQIFNTKLQQINLDYKEHDFGELTFVYSLKGAVIKEIIINRYNEKITFDNLFLTQDYLDKDFSVDIKQDNITFDYNNGELIKSFTVKDNFVIKYNVVSKNKTDLVLLSQTKEKNATSARYQQFFYKIDELKKEKWTKLPKILPIYNKAQYVGLKDRYYLALFYGNENIQIDYSNNAVNFYEKEKLLSTGYVYLGPQLHDELARINKSEVVKRGFIGNILYKILSFFYKLTNNWGLSIVLLALCVYFICFPLTSKSTQSMKKMQELQPKMEKLKEKYKDDPQTMQQETIKLYSEHKVNPVSGCLPLFLQMPIFIALYQLLFKFVELKGAKFLWIKDLSIQDYLIHLPNTLPLIGDGIHLLPIIMSAMTFVQQKLTSSGNEMTEQQKTMIMVMPVMLLFIFYRFPAGLVLYWLTNSTMTCLYQIYLAKKK